MNFAIRVIRVADKYKFYIFLVDVEKWIAIWHVWGEFRINDNSHSFDIFQRKFASFAIAEFSRQKGFEEAIKGDIFYHDDCKILIEKLFPFDDFTVKIRAFLNL